MSSIRLRALAAVLAGALALCGTAYRAVAQTAGGPSGEPSFSDLIGVTRLTGELGLATPIGRGIALGHVEGDRGDYLPQTASDAYQGVDFELHSGPSQINAHSDMTTRVILGRGGLAPGVAREDCYTVRDWVGRGLLRSGMAAPPLVAPVPLYTHSWISPPSPACEEVLRRVDYLADTQGVLLVVAVNNGKGHPVPAMLASAYNVISVGQWAGNSSGGYTVVEGDGRCKPEIVAPGDATSVSTPVVAAVAARLMETARLPDASPDARRPQVLKAVLLAGAQKPPGWHCEAGKPLAEYFGAGRVRLDLSYHILVAGPADTAASPAPGSLSPTAPGIAAEAQASDAPPAPIRLRNRYGWSYAALGRGQSRDYLFTTPRPLGEASLVLVWHRRIDGRVLTDMLTGRPYWSNFPRLAHLDLSLFVRDAAGHETLAKRSASAVDNLQHIYLPTLGPGRYRIEVRRTDTMDEAWDYALAWRIESSPNPPSR